MAALFGLLALPDEIIAQIFSLCDIESLRKLAQACKRFDRCVNTESVWKAKFLEVSGGFSIPQKLKSVCHYRDMCKRYCSIFGLSHPPADFPECSRCGSSLCSSICIQEREEIIIFDFGSKTTWLKYASESTGQLSMHPTVGPVTPLLNEAGQPLSPHVGQVGWPPGAAAGPTDALDPDSWSGNEHCPVCTKNLIIRTRHSSRRNQVRDGYGAAASSSKPERWGHAAGSRFASAFSKLSLRKIHCFDSSSLTDDEVGVAVEQLDVLEAAKSDRQQSLARRDDSLASVLGDELGIALLSERVQNLSDKLFNVGEVTEEAKAEVDSAKVVPGAPERQAAAVAEGGVGVAGGSESLVPPEPQTAIYQFLIRHMFRRNPFFQVKTIPFVMCQPTGSDRNFKRELLEYIFIKLKVPGVCFIPKPIATALYSGLDTCLVIDSGANNTVVTPVVDQAILQHCMQLKPLGGTYLTRQLHDCIKNKALDFELDEVSLDSSQVKKECYLAYNFQAMSRRKMAPKTLHVKGTNKQGKMECHELSFSHELYLASEDMYLHLDLPGMVIAALAPLDGALKRRLLSNIVMTGGNSRLTGLGLRLTRDLQERVPEHAVVTKVLDPRLMTGRTDAVIGASYIRKWDEARWVTQQDFILHGAALCVEDCQQLVHSV